MQTKFLKELQPLVDGGNHFKIPINQIKVINHEKLLIGTTETTITKNVFNQICELTGFDPKTAGRVDGVIGDGSSGVIMSQMTTLLGKNKDQEAIVLLNSKQRIERIVNASKAEAAVPLVKFNSICQKIIESGRRLTAAHYDTTGTECAVVFTGSELIDIGIKGEEVRSGLALGWDMFGSVKFYENIERHACTNQLLSQGHVGKFLNNNSSPEDWMQQLFNSANEKKTLSHYRENVLRAMSSNLSVREFMQFMKHLGKNYKTANGWRDVITSDGWLEQYAGAGVDFESMSTGQLSNCQTSIPTWDAVNTLTSVGSHSKVDSHTRLRTKKLASKFLYGAYDSENWLPKNMPTFLN